MGYNLARDYSGSNFFDGWDFYGSWDNLTLSQYPIHSVSSTEVDVLWHRCCMVG